MGGGRVGHFAPCIISCLSFLFLFSFSKLKILPSSVSPTNLWPSAYIAIWGLIDCQLQCWPVATTPKEGNSCHYCLLPRLECQTTRVFILFQSMRNFLKIFLLWQSFVHCFFLRCSSFRSCSFKHCSIIYSIF